MISNILLRIAILISICALILISPLLHVSATANTGTWSYDQYYDGMAHVSVGRVTSTVNQVLDCTIVWTGVSVATGQSVQGSTGMRLPAYSGSGQPLIGRSAFPVTKFISHATCN